MKNICILVILSFSACLSAQSVYEINNLLQKHEYKKEGVVEHLGTHIIAEFMGCSFDTLDNHDVLADLLRNAAQNARATVLNVSTHKFEPYGMSGLVLLQESHISIHTWPEFGYAAIDIYTCGEHVSSQAAIDTLAAFFKPEHVRQIEIKRGFDKLMS
ncbi:MAG: adenosylmethionine decarboxylase [Candidatus Dependentiae bacterium]